MPLLVADQIAPKVGESVAAGMTRLLSACRDLFASTAFAALAIPTEWAWWLAE
jgi:hypothetical protein